MKLVEIKNSLAKLHYEPVDFPLILSDFLTIDDGNQKIIAQVVSIESTNIDTTNCAVLKFTIDLNDDGEFSSYSGYVPSLDALVSKTKKSILETIFSDEISGLNIGKIVSSSNLEVNFRKSLTEKFLYVQADKIDDIQNITQKFIEFNLKENKKTLYIDFDGINNYQTNSLITLGSDFKLPINNDVLNYIYENDLNSLTIEQKTIVQDIILDIQEYIKTLADGFIPFNKLLSVVNEIYTTDKSIGVILLRNKLIKYSQMNIFANNKEEIDLLNKSLTENTITTLCLKNTSIKWQKETLNLLINNIAHDINIIFNINDEIIDTELLNKMYKSQQIKPIITSKYESIHSSQLKSFAQNLILFKPITQQKDFATYNSFFNKINQNELIISGESTFYTPLIIKSLSKEIKIVNNIKTEEINDTIKNSEIQEVIVPDSNEYKAKELAEAITENLIDDSDINEEQQVNETEITIEDEIAKDVDKMFLADKQDSEVIDDKVQSDINDEKSVNYDEMFEDVDFDILDEINETKSSNLDTSNEIIEEIDSDIINLEISETEQNEISMNTDEQVHFTENNNKNVSTEPFISSDIIEDTTDTLPIYTTELNEEQNEKILNIAEGNIVYHEKYGRGVVEQLISYGKKTLCSIQFDNVGRRLLDPSLADLKQM